MFLSYYRISDRLKIPRIDLLLLEAFFSDQELMNDGESHIDILYVILHRRMYVDIG